MPLSSIAQVLLRLFALKWLLGSLIALATAGFLFYDNTYFQVRVLIQPVGTLIAGLILWKYSPLISRLLAERNDSTLSLNGVNQQQLFATVVFGLGIYFAVGSLADLTSWLHYFASSRFVSELQMDNSTHYQFFEVVLTLVVGIALVLNARKLARKFCPDEDNEKAAT